MRLIKRIFASKREMERIEALGKVFPYSRAEDIAKVFELGRIHALHQLKSQVYAGFGILAALIGIFGYYFVQDYFHLKINNVIESRVNQELEKRIKDFNNFYSYTKEAIPLSILILKASNDNRYAFFELLNMSKTIEPASKDLKDLKELANDAILNIIANLALNIGPHLSYQQDRASTESNHIDREIYKKNRHWMYRVGFLEGIWMNNRIAQRDKFEFMVTVLREDESLRAVEQARQILEEKVRIGGDVRNVDQYIALWERDREKILSQP